MPSGITKIKVQVAGAGGGGGGQARQDNDGNWNAHGRAGKGGNGELLNEYISVISLESISITVGEGGSGGHYQTNTGISGSNGSPGGSSFCKNIIARGGGGRSLARNHYNDYDDGISYGNGGTGGAAGSGRNNGESGNNGWVIIEYGQGIE